MTLTRKVVLAFSASAALYFLWDATRGIRAIESLVRPVIHKELVNRYAGIYKEDPLFVTALIKVESNFIRKAKSSRGAVGLMQIMPMTGSEIAAELKVPGYGPGDLERPEVNIRFGFHYLSKLRKEFGEDDVAVLAAYNAGPKNAREWISQSRSVRLAFSGIPFPETRRFAEDVLSTYGWLKRLRPCLSPLMERP